MTRPPERLVEGGCKDPDYGVNMPPECWHGFALSGGARRTLSRRGTLPLIFGFGERDRFGRDPEVRDSMPSSSGRLKRESRSPGT